MKNSHLLIVIALAGIAGYFAYPFFNPKSAPLESSSHTSAQVSRNGTDASSPTTSKEDSSVANDIASQTVPHENSTNTVTSEDDTSPGNRKSEVTESDSKESRVSSHATTFSNSPNGSGNQKNDFSSYKLTNNESRLSISESDPRFHLLQGRYEGNYKGSPAVLIIGPQKSTLTLTGTIATDDIVLIKDNEKFFSNVFDNGNLLKIESDKAKLVLDISAWPGLKLAVGPEEAIYLLKN